MKAPLSLVLFCCASALAGCNYRFYIQKKAEWASPEVAAQVKFPGSTVGSLSLDGPTLKAIDVAMNEFLPPGARVKSHDERLAQCLSRRETYDISVLHADSLFFVTLSADLSRCGFDLDVMVMDAGAVYAVDSQGRILGKR